MLYKVTTMKPTLFVLAAGMGSRYGGLKQLDSIGPDGQTIMDYSVYDAMRAGFGKVVFVIRKDFEDDFRKKVLAKYENHIPVEVVFQSPDALPEGYTAPAGRTKPWGTNHAVLMGASAIHEPFAVINADDFYGREAFETLAQYLGQIKPEEKGRYCMVAYKVGNTMTENGAVSRGVCTVDANGKLDTVVERTAIRFDDQHRIEFTDENGKVQYLDAETPVSMNCWGFSPDYFDYSEREFRLFLDANEGNLTAEYYIPWAVNTLMHKGEATVDVLSSNARWFGVTYPEDRAGVVENVNRLHASGDYPTKFFE